MALLKDYRWLWVVLVVLLLSFIICIIFLCINKWISRQGKHILHLDNRSNVKADQRYQPTNFQTVNVSTPPLPPRTQFLIQETQSYENLPEEPDYEDLDEKLDYDYEQDKCDQNIQNHSDYVEVDSEPDLPSYEQPDDAASTEDYDDVLDADQEEDYDDLG